MPVVSVNPNNQTYTQPNVPRAEDKSYAGAMVDTTSMPNVNLITHISGSRWKATYFSQILGKSDQLSGQQVTLDPSKQQYKRYLEMELKVSSPLSSSQDAATGNMELGGSATMYPVLIPNVGDMFIANVGNGETGLFRVTKTTRNSIYKNATYSIDYIAIGKEDALRYGDLVQKTVESVVFVLDFYQHGLNPYLHEEEYANIQKLMISYAPLLDYYMNTFFNNNKSTLLVPNQNGKVYDSYFMSFFKSVFDQSEHPTIRNIRLISDGDDPCFKKFCIWDAIKQRDKTYLETAWKKYCLVDTRFFPGSTYLTTYAYIGFDYVIYPQASEIELFNVDIDKRKPPAPIGLVSNANPIDPVIPDPNNINQTLPLIHNVEITADSHYVFSSAFYAGTKTEMSQLELAITYYLDNEPIPLDIIFRLSETAKKWGYLERYYYIPLVLILLRYGIKTQ